MNEDYFQYRARELARELPDPQGQILCFGEPLEIFARDELLRIAAHAFCQAEDGHKRFQEYADMRERFREAIWLKGAR